MALRTYLESARLEFLIPAPSDKSEIVFQITKSDSIISDESGTQIAEWILEHWQTHSFGPCLIREKLRRTIVGLAGLKEVSQDGQLDVDFGMSFLPTSQRQGYGFESGVVWFEHGFASLKLSRIVSTTTSDNVGVLKLFPRWGFDYVEEISYVDALGREIPSQLWELIPQRFYSLRDRN